MRTPRRPVASLTLLLMLAAAPVAMGGGRQDCSGANVSPSHATLAEMRSATLCLVNQERADRDLEPLRSNASLARAASGYASRMVRQDFFGHVAPDGSSMLHRIRRTKYLRGGIKRWSVGENLAWGSGALATPLETVEAWMRSPGHRANILDRGFEEIGVGISLGAPVPGYPSAGTYVTNFGTRVR